MGDESVPGICQECPQSCQNFYTKSWYCVNSGAPLGSKRAWDYCTSPRRAEGLVRSDGAAHAQAGAPAAGAAAGSPSSQVGEAAVDGEAESTPNTPIEADGANFSLDVIADEQSENAQQDLLYGYPFDCLLVTPQVYS